MFGRNEGASSIWWWIGCLVTIATARNLILMIIQRNKSLAFWSSPVQDAMAPITNESQKSSLPWIVVSVAKRDVYMECVIGKIAERWPGNPILILAAGEVSGVMKRCVQENGSRACEVMKMSVEGELVELLKERVVGLVLSCVQPSVGGKRCDEWSAEEIRSEIWSTFRQHTMIARVCLPHMVGRGSGAIVALCSEIPEFLAGGRSIQSAVASGLEVFARAMQTECRSKNILFQTWLYKPGGLQIRILPAKIRDFLTEDDPEHFADRSLSCLETGATAWIFPLGYSPSVIRPLIRQEILATIAQLVPTHLLFAIKQSTASVF